MNTASDATASVQALCGWGAAVFESGFTMPPLDVVVRTTNGRRLGGQPSDEIPRQDQSELAETPLEEAALWL